LLSEKNPRDYRALFPFSAYLSFRKLGVSIGFAGQPRAPRRVPSLRRMHLFIGENYWLFSPQWPGHCSGIMNSFQRVRAEKRAEINLNLGGNLLTHRGRPFTLAFSISLPRRLLNQPTPPAILSTESPTKCANLSRLSRHLLFVLSVRSPLQPAPASRQIDTIPHGQGRSLLDN